MTLYKGATLVLETQPPETGLQRKFRVVQYTTPQDVEPKGPYPYVIVLLEVVE